MRFEDSVEYKRTLAYQIGEVKRLVDELVAEFIKPLKKLLRFLLLKI